VKWSPAVHGLVPLPVLVRHLPPYVGREWDLPVPLERYLHTERALQTHQPLPLFEEVDDLDRELRRDLHLAPRPELRSRPNERGPEIFALRRGVEEEDLGGPPTGATPSQSGRKHPGLVQNERVAWVEKFDQVAEDPMLKAPRGAVHHEEPALIASLGRVLRDLSGRQLEVVVRGAEHWKGRAPRA
jgi:hypothetical protein